jgi:transcriptional regulator with XRE-family HTH domain
MNEVIRSEIVARAATESDFNGGEHAAPNFMPDKPDSNAIAPENSDATIRRVLSSYEIGTKLRALRLKKKIALVDLGKHTGLSASMLSQLENGKLVPTLPTLARIAMVFDVGLDHFFGDRRRKRLFAIVRASERMKFPDKPGSPRPDFWFECLAFSAQDKSIQAYLAEFPRRGEGEPHEHFHEGAEFLHVVEGGLAIHYQGEEHVLDAGDSVYFDASEPHSYRSHGATPARALVITTPPRS